MFKKGEISFLDIQATSTRGDYSPIQSEMSFEHLTKETSPVLLLLLELSESKVLALTPGPILIIDDPFTKLGFKIHSMVGSFFGLIEIKLREDITRDNHSYFGLLSKLGVC